MRNFSASATAICLPQKATGSQLSYGDHCIWGILLHTKVTFCSIRSVVNMQRRSDSSHPRGDQTNYPNRQQTVSLAFCCFDLVLLYHHQARAVSCIKALAVKYNILDKKLHVARETSKTAIYTSSKWHNKQFWRLPGNTRSRAAYRYTIRSSFVTTRYRSRVSKWHTPNDIWCAILIAHQIVMAKHGGSCVHFSEISTCGRTSRETVSHPQCPPLPTLCKISLPIYVIMTNKLLQPLTTTWFD